MKAKDLLDNMKSAYYTSRPNNQDNFTQKQNILLDMIKNKEILKKADRYVYEFIYMPLYNVLDEEERRIFDDILVDSIQIPKINAHTIKTDEEEYLIVITEKLMALLHSWNEIQLKIATDRNITNEEAIRAFAPIIDCYITPNSGYALPIFSLDELSIEYCLAATQKTMMHETFIIAHEMAHIYLGHLKDKKGVSSFMSEQTFANFYETKEAIEREYAADVQAVKWISRLNNVSSALTMYVEALVAFHFIECNLGFPSAESSHPASFLRLINLKNECNKYFKDCKYTLDEMISICMDIEGFRIAVL